MKKKKILSLVLAIALVTLATSIFLVPAAAALPTATEDTEIDVWLMAGQSNATGYGDDTNSTVADSDTRFTNGFPNVYYYGQGDSYWRHSGNRGYRPVRPFSLFRLILLFMLLSSLMSMCRARTYYRYYGYPVYQTYGSYEEFYEDYYNQYYGGHETHSGTAPVDG